MADHEEAENRWIDVNERLPEKTDWYLVFSPSFWSRNADSVEGLMFAHFKVTKDGKKFWDLERTHNKSFILYWRPIPIPTEFGDIVVKTAKDGWKTRKWVDHKSGKTFKFP